MMLDCFKCNTKLEPVFEGADNQPHAGTTFSTAGHYGSTFFDPMDHSTLEIIICDRCLMDNRQYIAYRGPSLFPATPEAVPYSQTLDNRGLLW